MNNNVLKYINSHKERRQHTRTVEWYEGIAYRSEKVTNYYDTLTVDEAKEACKIAEQETTEKNTKVAVKFIYNLMRDFGNTHKDSVDVASKLYTKMTKKKLDIQKFLI